ncbi:MAG TPA: nitrate/sulfonate/bicarbonate ABC transporter ATP-binding protein [Caulobacteraceae bacterium]|jgi:NitT/TauT family transport system ATP-binding protein|nr:nitrate/sulfonate/bicarbonate ABC transporter ATP-binding protein [Caulobacteraceae bacterium]
MPRPPDAQRLLEVQDVRISYGIEGKGPLVLDGVNVVIEEGEIVSLLGRSGSGKSSLLRIIAGLLKPTQGRAMWEGQPVTGPYPGVAMVFQSFALFPWLTVQENVELGLEAQRLPAAERGRRAEDAIDLIGLGGFESAYPKELSGGMRQRVGFARALVVHPELLLMDEPFSALDVLTAETMRTDIIDLWIEGRLPIRSVLMVTHNIEEAVLMSDRILILSSNPGRIIAEIKITLPHPRNRDDPRFRQQVDEIYGRMTQRMPGDKGDQRGGQGFPGVGVGMALPPVSTNELAGLMETLSGSPDGRADLPALAEELNFEVDDLFPIAETLQLLRFAEVAQGDIQLTAAGRRFAESDLEDRKRLFAEHLIAYVPLAALIKRVLDERPNHRARAARFSEELEDFMSEDYAEDTLKAVVAWCRFAELFTYDEADQSFSLEAA